MNRRLFAVLLALCVLFSAVFCLADESDDDWDDDDDGFESLDEEEMTDDFTTVSSYHVSIMEADDFKYKYNEDKTAAILTYYVGENPEVIFPETVENNLPVIAIDTGMCADNGVITSIRIPGSIKTIGNNAFARCANLKSIVIEEGVEEIGMCSFGGCPELTTVELPDSLQKVGIAGFAYCAVLEEVEFGASLESIGAQAFAGCASLVRIVVPGGDRVVIPDNVFDLCPNEVEIVVP